MAAPTLIGSPASASTSGHSTAGAYSAFTYTVSAGSNRCLVLFISTGENPPVSATAATYGGQAGTAVTGYSVQGATYCLTQAFYWLESAIAAAGSTTFSLTTWSATVVLDSLIVGAAAWSDVHQTTPFGTVVSANGSSTAPSTGSITLGTDEIAIGSVCTDDDNAFAQGSTLLFEVEGVSGDLGGGAQYRTTTGALAWTTDNMEWAAAGVPLKPLDAGGGRTTKNTRAWPLGMELGMGFGMAE